MKRRGNSGRSNGLQQSAGPATPVVAEEDSASCFGDGLTESARLVAFISPSEMLLSAWPTDLKRGRFPQVMIGSLRCHRTWCESTSRNFGSCPKLKHLVMVLDLAFECGWQS
jgi:hypothetical protein